MKKMREARPGAVYVLTVAGELALPVTERCGAVAYEQVRGRERSVPAEWHKKGYVVEVYQR